MEKCIVFAFARNRFLLGPIVAVDIFFQKNVPGIEYFFAYFDETLLNEYSQFNYKPY